MYYPVTLIIGIRFFYKNNHDKFTTFVAFLSTIGISLGVLSLITVLSVMNGYENNLEKKVLNFTPHILVYNKDNNSINIKNNITKKLIFSKIKYILPVITGEVLIQSNKKISFGIIWSFLKSNECYYFFNKDIDKKINSLKNNKYQIILGSRLAKYLQVKKGDKVRITVLNNNYYNIIYNLPIQRIFFISDILHTNSEFDNHQIFLNFYNAQKIMNYPYNHVTGWRLYLEHPLKLQNVLKHKKYIEKEKNILWSDWREEKGELFQAVKMEKIMMTILVSFIILISSFNFFTFLGLLIIDKKKEIAILKTQGIQNKQIIKIFIFQGLISGIQGILIGTLLSFLLLKQLNNIMPFINKIYNYIELPIYISIQQIFYINLYVLFLILISVIYPAYYAAYKINPVKVLKYE